MEMTAGECAPGPLWRAHSGCVALNPYEGGGALNPPSPPPALGALTSLVPAPAPLTAFPCSLSPAHCIQECPRLAVAGRPAHGRCPSVVI